MTRIYFFKSNGLTKKDQVKMTKVGTNLLSDTAKRRQKDGNETATSDKVIIRTPLGHFLRYVAMIFAVLVMSMANVGMAWGAESATNDPATVSYGTGGAAKTFLNVSNTVANCTISSGSVACVTYGLYEMDKNWKPAFYSGPANGSSSSYNYSDAASVGFMAGSSAGTGTAANKSATSGYGAAKYTSSAEAVIYVTGITGIAVMGKDNNTSGEKRLYIKVEEYAADGTCTAVGTGDGITKSSYNKSLHITTFDAGTLSGTKYYKVTLTSGNTSNCETSQIRFTKYIAPSCTEPTSPTNGASTSSSRVVSWTAPGSAPAGGYLVAYSSAASTAPGDAVQAAGTNGSYTVVAVAAGTTTATLSALSASTTYKWWVRSKCGDSSFSSWVAGTAFTTDAPSCGETAQAALTLSSNSGTICGTGTKTFTVSGGSGTGALSVSSSAPSKATASIDGSTVTVTGVAAGSATITVTKACDATYAEATATYSATVAAVPTANAGEDKTTEPGNGVALAATAAASGCTGAWTIQSGPNTSTAQLSSTSSATATFTPTEAGTYTLRWTVTNSTSGCSAQDDMTVTAAVCSISSCGNATLTYAINGGSSGDHSEGGADLISSATASNTTALGASTTVGYTGISMSSLAKKAAAATSTCYPTKPNMSGKIGVYNGSSYSSSNYLQFTFTVKSGYTFTPCDIQFTVQPVDVATNFRWEITNGTNVYGYGTATDVPKGSDGGASVLTGLTSTAEMAAGTYYIRLYPYVNAASKTFRISNNVILKGTTAAVASDAYDIHIGKNNDNYTDESLTNTSGSTWSKTVTLDAGSYYEFKVKKTPSAGDAVWYGNNGKITATTSPAWDFNTSDSNCKLYTTVAGSYTFSWDASTNKLTVTYPAGDHPTKRIYMACGSTWCDASPKFFVHSWGVTEYNTQVQESTCDGYYADIIWYNDYFQFTRNASNATAYDNNQWNVSQDLTYNSSQPKWTCTGWSDGKGTFSSSAYTPTTYTISYATGSTTATGGAAISGSKANETKTCGVDFTLPSSAVFTAAGYTQVGWTTTDGGAQTHALGGSYTGNAAQTFYPVWEATASLTALECNTLYKVNAMVPASITLTGEGQYGAGLSANTKFEVIGDPSKTDQAGGAPEMKNISTVTIDGTDFGAAMYLKRAANISSTLPTSHAVKFIVPETGKLVMYVKRSDRLYLIKEGGSAVSLGSSDSNVKVEKDVTAGTYYIYANNTNTVVYGLKLVTCTTPAAPTAFSAGSITSTGATFSITDGGDAASYDIYYSTSSTAPTASTPATTTSTSKTKAVTGLTANTTYYAWVRSVCDADHKSDWVALTGSSFTTSAAAALNDGCWDPANTAADKLTSGDVTLMAFDNNFSDVAGITSVTIESKGTGSSGQCSGADETTPSGYMKVKDASSSGVKIITIVTSAAKDITIGGQNYNSNTGSFYLVKSTAESTKLAECNTGATSKATNCPAGTYYVYAKASTKSINFSLLCIEDAAPDVTAPTFVSSVPANGATDVATSGTIVLTFNEALGTVDPSKFTLTGATKGAVAIDGSDATKVNIAYSGAANEATVTLATAAAAVSDLAGNALAAALSNISFTTAAAAPATKDIYYGAITITAGALTKGSTGTSQFFTNIGGTIANNTEISWSSGPGTGGEYYESNVLTDTELSKSSNWNTSSGSNRYVGGMKFQSGSTYTLALGSKVASSITFYGRNGSASKTMTVGGEDWTSSATKNTFAKHEFIKTGGFTGNVSITQDGDFYGILVITIQTATPCTPPVIPALSNQSLCEGTDIAEWDATQTAVLADGETVTYSWKKKGNATELANTATFDLGSSATEAMAGTYVVTATVSKTGYASSTATKEVTLTVTAAVEEPVITANKATVYPGNSVTLTATCGTNGVTWNWYLCANADGTGAGSSLGTSSSYTIASAGAAGTYYYKAVATGSCGTAERVYTLVVTAASECEKYFWFVYAADATSNGVINNRDNFFGSSPKTGSSNSSTYKFTLDGTEYTATRNTGDNTFSISFTVPEGSTATLALNCKGSSSKPIYLIPTSGDPVLITDNSSNAAHVVENIAAGTYKVGAKTDASASWTLAGMAVQVCTASSCTDATPTITAANTTVCVGSELSISSTGYETGATFQWQKLNSSTSTWDNISGASSATYTVATAAAEHAGSYRLVATKECARTSNTVTISVPLAPNFGSTVPASVSVMQTIALSINTVEATDAVKYKWYKSADATWDAGDTEIGTNKELIKAYDSEAIGSPSYYIFCRAQNACGITTSDPITVNVIAFVEEDCATRGNEGEAQFGFVNTSAGQGSYQSTNCWTMNSNSKYLTYTAPEGKYFKTMKVTIASSSASKASYNWSTNGGTTFTEVAINSINTTLTEKTIGVSAHGNVNALQIGRNLDGKGESSGTLYVSKICFEYTDACTATTVTPDESSKTYEMGGGSFTEPTFTVKHGGTAFDPQPTLTYSSSNEDIASVDDDGTVTFNGDAGTVTITASYAGDGTYCASSGSYTITVSCPGGAPKIVPASSVDLSGCNSSVTLHAKKQDGTAFDDGTYQWFRNGEEIDGATSSSYTATQAGTYTVERTNTSDCTTPSTNSAVVTSETTEPEVERLVPFQYYHVNKTYSDQMKMRHLFAVKNSGTLDGKHFKMYVSRNGGAATDVTSSDALVVWSNGDGHVDTVMVDLNKLSDKKKYSENDELVFTCKAIDCNSNISDVYKNTITMNVIGATPTLALICSGSSKAEGTRKTGELTVGGDFLTGYNVADLCQQTGNTSFDANTEWGLYTDLKTQYIVTPVNGYAVFNKLNYEPFDILLLTDYPKASKSDAAADVLDDMAALCDYRPMLSFKTHMVAKSPSKWAAKGFTTSPVVTKADGKLNLNIVCYAHPMFESLTEGADVYKDNGDLSQLVYTMLSEPGYESSKGMQGFEIAAAENFVTIGLTHYNGTIAKNSPSIGKVTWTPNDGDRMLVTVAERQTNTEARFILFSINCGAQSKLTAKGEEVILACLEYLLDDDPLHVADCALTFDNGAGNTTYDAGTYAGSGVKGDGKWSTEANWGPQYLNIPGEFNSARIAAPVTVDMEHAKAMELRIVNEGSINIPAGKGLEVTSTIRRMDGSEIYPTDVNDIHIGSSASGNGTLIFNNNAGDSKARVDMYSKGFIDGEGVKNYQYIGTPFKYLNALYNYYGSWIYSWDIKKNGNWGWVAVKNGGPMSAWTGYCITQESPAYYETSGTMTETGTVDIAVPAGNNMVVGNSWTAPIDINALTPDDLEGLVANIYFFNTGVDKNGTGGAAGERYAGGTYVTVPVEVAKYDGEDDHINSMQGFFVKNTSGSDGTLHLDYDRHVRGTTRSSIIGDALHAPARRTALSSDEPTVLKIKVSGENYDDKLLLLEREDFTEGFDNGWDGDKWDGNESALYIYTTDNEGTENSVSAVPELEGTIIGFRAGEDDAYTLNFEYLNSDEPLYLYDSENSTYTRIMTGVTYRFFTTDKSKHARFIITRKSPQITTAVGNVSDDGLRSSKVKKLLLDNKLFILRNGMLYDATGKVVK